MRYGKKLLAGILCVLFVCPLFQIQEKQTNIVAATEDWKFNVSSSYPLDRVETHVVDENHGNAKYYVGYRNGTVAIMDEKKKLIAQTEYPLLEIKKGENDGESWTYTYYKGKPALIVKTVRGYGMCDLKGKEIYPCKYKSIDFEENVNGHGIYTLCKSEKEKETWVDGKYKINHIKYPFLLKYKGKVRIFSYNFKEDNTKEGEGSYTYYDLTGKKLGTVSFHTLINSPYNTSWDLDRYESACTQWLKDNCQKAEVKAKAYYEKMGYCVDNVASFTGYNYVKGRQNEIFYYVIVQAEVSYETEEEGTITLGNTNYAFVYQEDKTLVMEGQTNLSKDDLEENDVLMLDVVILSQDGTVRCMERYTGKIKTLYTTNANTLFCEIDTCEEEYFEKYHLRGLVENKVYKANPPVNYYTDYTVSYSVDYTMDYLLGIGEEHTGYVMTTGEKITYDWTGAYSLYGVSTGEKQTQIYCITDKIVPIDEIDVSIEQLNKFHHQGCVRFQNSLAWISYQAQTVYFANEHYCLSWSFEELGITSNDCVFEKVDNYDDLAWFSIKENHYQYNPYSSSSIYYSFLLNIKTGQVNFLGKQDEVPNWMTQKTTTYKLTLGSYCYLYEDGMVYTINTQTLTIEETDLRDVFEGEKAVASLEELNGKPYIRYTVPRDEKEYFYGYMDLQGNIKIDALLTKVVKDENIYHDTTKCRQFGSYLLFGKFLFDLDFNVIGREMRIVYIQEQDNVRGSLMETGLVSIYNRYAGEQFMGFLYDSKTETIIKKYDKLTDVYLGLNVYDYRRDRYGHYYAMKLSDEGGIAWFDINTKKEVARGKGYCYVEEQEKNYNILEDSKKVKEPDIILDMSYAAKGGMYRVISVKNKLVSLNECNSKTPNFIIPDTIKIKGKRFKVIAIDEKAFYGKTKLTKVIVGKNVKEIGEKAFLNCKKLKSMIIKGKGLTSVDKTALTGTNKKLIIKVPSAKKTAYKKLWKGKGNASVTIK